jgi:predicted ATPase
VNFELKLGKLNLLLGANGSGKTSVFDVLRSLQNYIRGDLDINAAFPEKDFTAWSGKKGISLELDFVLPDGEFNYSLQMEYAGDDERGHIKSETLTQNNNVLFERKLTSPKRSVVTLYNDNYQGNTQWDGFDLTRSALAYVDERPDNKKLISFRRQIENLLIIAFNPFQMSAKSEKEATVLLPNSENFTSWYRNTINENLEKLHDVFDVLRETIPNFLSFTFNDLGLGTKVFNIHFALSKEEDFIVDFSRISQGQKILIILYILIYGIKDKDRCLFLDEPDNFVALREIQPWLAHFIEKCGDNFQQAALISHNPEVIDQIGVAQSQWFEKNDNGVSQLADYKAKLENSPLSFSQHIARGDIE